MSEEIELIDDIEIDEITDLDCREEIFDENNYEIDELCANLCEDLNKGLKAKQMENGIWMW